jgi:hypothetical protein
VKWLDLKAEEMEKMEVLRQEGGGRVKYKGKEYFVQVTIEEGYVYAVMREK